MNTTVDIPFLQKINAIGGIIITVMSYFLGPHWFLFFVFFLLNIADYISGYIKSYLTKKINSKKGLQGLLKKLSYWIMVVVAFGMSTVLVEIGLTLDIDLHVTIMLGYFVLCSLIINEMRSILENLVDAGVNVPKWLTRGLEVASKAVEDKIKSEVEKNNDDGHKNAG